MKEIDGFNGMYFIDENGIGWSAKRGQIRQLKPKINKQNGCHTLGLYKNGKPHYFYIHRLVLEAFIGPCPKGMEACHFPDPDYANNKLSNLRWATHLDNIHDKQLIGTQLKGKEIWNSKLIESDVLEIRRLYRDANMTQEQIASRFNISRENVRDIINFKRWRWLN